MSHCDTPVSQPEPDAAAYKHYMTAFMRDINNLAKENGSRKTICGRLNFYATGLLNNVSAINDETAEASRKTIDKFYKEVHYPFLKEYPTDIIKDTPLGLYHENVSKLYTILCHKLAAAA